MEMVDNKSILGSCLAMVIGLISQQTLSSFLMVVSIAVGITTIAYNGIKIYKEFKNKNDGKSS